MIRGLPFLLLAVCEMFLYPFLVSAAPISTNDTFLGRQWYLDSISARDGWSVTTGSRNVLVAVIDGVMDITHEDLRQNLWTNQGEIPENGVDDDGNGYTDDVHGWNFVTDHPDVEPRVSVNGSNEAWMHATAVASMIAAAGNNDIGISGMAWRVRIMPLVVLNEKGTGEDAQLIHAIRYAVANGADIINLSVFGAEHDETLAQVIREVTAQGVLIVSAAGNGRALGGRNLNLAPGYPACAHGIRGRGTLTVTALTRNNRKGDHANYGSCVDVSAPGTDLFAARPARDARTSELTAGYVGGLTGTSIAAPLVSGLAVLLKAIHPTWRGPELARRIIDTADSVDNENPAYRGMLGSGKINVLRALTEDEQSNALGPLSIEGSRKGFAPEVRIRTASGTEIARFAVGESGDRRGVRAAFVRWQGALQPDIAVTMAGDFDGAWRVYRPDGLLIAAGSVGPVNGGLMLSAEDLNLTGRDVLFLGEARGRRAWIVTPETSASQEIEPFFQKDVFGMVGLSLARPVPAFVVAAASGKQRLTLITRGGERTDVSESAQSSLEWKIRRGARLGDTAIFEVTDGRPTAPKLNNRTYVGDPTGLHETVSSTQNVAWVEMPQGEHRDGWSRYGVWPR